MAPDSVERTAFLDTGWTLRMAGHADGFDQCTQFLLEGDGNGV